MAKCSGTTKQGEPCKIDAEPSGLCHVHDPARQCGQPNRYGRPCTVASGGGPCVYHGGSPNRERAKHTPPKPGPPTNPDQLGLLDFS
jgi:hypothetical protein